MQTQFEIISDVEVLHTAQTEGLRVVRIQKIRNKETGQVTLVRFWANFPISQIVRVE